jgi:archaellum component FlaG (FlaF/FlaG flagellin family)
VDTAGYLEVAGQTVSRDATWTAAIPYVISNNITVKGTDGADGVTTLTIEPGVVVKLNSSRYINIGASSGDPGALIAQGTSENQILFTSNQANPAPGDWNYIRFYNTADDDTTVMEHCVVEYGGYGSGALYLYNASPKIQNNTIRNSKTAGIYASGGGTSTATISCNTFTGNQNGIHWTASPPPQMHNNNFAGNTNYGLNYSGSQTLNAENNWWGDSAGPNQAGDKTNGNVDADPWSTQENDCTGDVENQPPHTPSNPTPADAAVRVSTAGGVSLSWSGGDPNALDVVSYDLYWGTSPGSLQLAAADINGTTYTKDPVDQGLTYHWQIMAKDDKGAQTAGPIWHFTADGDPPDLTISHVTTDPAGNLQSGQSVTFTATVQNSGSGPAVDSFAVDFLIDGTSIGTVDVNQILLAGQTIQVSQSWTYAGGDPAIEIFADNQGQISETNEDNNRYIGALSEVTDNTAPALMGSSPDSGDHLQQIQQITATLYDNQSAVDDAAVTASFSVTNSGQQSIAGTVTESDDTFTFVPANLPLPDDTYQVSLTASDVHGNAQNYAFDFTIDTQPPGKPVITGGVVDSGTIRPRPTQNTTGQFVIELTGTREAGTSVWIDGVEKVAVGETDWSAPLTLMPGINAFEIWLEDRAGNRGNSEWVDIDMQTAVSNTFEYDAAGRIKRLTSQ